MSAASFAPGYRLKPQEHFLSRQQLKSHRSHTGQGSLQAANETSASGSEDDEQVLSSIQHPVNSTDPYHVAGYARERTLPPPPFPHGPAPTHKKSTLNVDRELAELKPPLLARVSQEQHQSKGLKHRHLDNLIVILHAQILKRDWERASRAFGLLIRTEIAGGVDIRRHDRWTLAGEILLHRTSSEQSVAPVFQSQIAEAGCKSARDLYERMILNYPYSQHLRNQVTEACIYPALFDVWIYEAQDRSFRARHAATYTGSISYDMPSSTTAHHSPRAERVKNVDIGRKELGDASEIASRMDKLISSPPYDTDVQMLRLRRMVALWISDICELLIAQILNDTDTGVRPILYGLELNELQQRAFNEEALGRDLLIKHDLIA